MRCSEHLLKSPKFDNTFGGIAPVSKLSPMSNISRLSMFPSVAGNVPVNTFPFNLIVSVWKGHQDENEPMIYTAMT